MDDLLQTMAVKPSLPVQRTAIYWNVFMVQPPPNLSSTLDLRVR